MATVLSSLQKSDVITPYIYKLTIMIYAIEYKLIANTRESMVKPSFSRMSQLPREIDYHKRHALIIGKRLHVPHY